LVGWHFFFFRFAKQAVAAGEAAVLVSGHREGCGKWCRGLRRSRAAWRGGSVKTKSRIKSPEKGSAGEIFQRRNIKT